MVTAENYAVAPHLKHLYKHLVENRYIQGIRNFNRELVRYRRLDVLARIAAGDDTWQQFVPPPIAEVIRRDHLFGYKGHGA